MRRMLILGIESSCDETGVALYEARAKSGLRAHALHSQILMHREYGGVVPELASRDHIRHTVPLLRQVLAQSGARLADLAAIAYTQGPGLAGALLVGAAFAEGLAAGLGIPTVPLHHLEGGAGRVGEAAHHGVVGRLLHRPAQTPQRGLGKSARSSR